MPNTTTSFSLPAALASIFLSLGIWFYVAMNETYDVVLDVPLNINVPEDKAIENEQPRFVQTLVSGSGWQMLQVRVSRLGLAVRPEIHLSLDNVDQLVIIEKTELERSMTLPPGFYDVKEIYLDSLLLKLGKISSKRVPIVLDAEIEPRAGFVVASDPKITPDSITIHGNNKVLADIDEWHTDQFVKKDVFKPFRERVRVSDSLSNTLKIPEINARVEVDVQQLADITFEHIPIQIVGAPRNARIVVRPTHVDVIVRGGIEYIANCSKEQISAVLEYRDIANSETGILKPNIRIQAENTYLSHTIPEAVRFVTVSDGNQ